MKKKHNLMFVDLVEDKIKNRGIFITASLLFYIYLTYTLIVGFRSINLKPAIIESPLQFAHYSNVGSNMTAARRTVVKVTNDDGNKLGGVNVTLNVIKVTSDPEVKTSPICDYAYRKNILGNFDYIRYHEVCKVRLEGNVATTDGSGNAQFNNFRIASGPEGYYTFQYSAKAEGYDEVFSEEFSTYIFSEVYSLESLNTLSLMDKFKLNEPLRVQPEVRILDVNNNPIAGKRVVAFSFVDVDFEGQGYRNSPSNLNLFLLENYVSEMSDENGIAKFTNLTIVGSNEIIGYIHFYCEGVTTVWTNRPTKFEYTNFLSPRAFYPSILDMSPYNIDVLNDVERSVFEGSKIDNPISIRVTDRDTSEPRPGMI